MRAPFPLLLLCLAAAMMSATRDAAARAALLVAYDPDASNFTLFSSDASIDARAFVRSAAAFSEDSPSGSAIFGASSSLLLTTSFASGRARLCEWNIGAPVVSTGPLRCVSLPAGPARDMVYAEGRVLVSVPTSNAVYSVEYSTFQVAPGPWMSSVNDGTFLSPSALEYDPNGGVVYVALENADAIRRYTPAGVFMDSASAPFVSIPRPRFMELARDAVPPSLYVLTSDLTLPELYRFRVPDGASLSTLANEEGDWYPSSNDSVRSMAISSPDGAMYTLWTGEDSISAFSLRTADTLVVGDGGGIAASLGAVKDVTLLNPVAFVRDEPSVSAKIAGVVDARSWTPTSPGAKPLYFDSCTPGAASGATLDADAVVKVLACSNETLLVADYRSIYRLRYTGSALCYDGTVVDPQEIHLGGSITDAVMGANSADELFFFANASTNWHVYSASRVCEGVGLVSLLNQSPATNASATLPPYAGNVARFALDVGVVCVLKLDSSALLACSNGTFGRLIPASLDAAIGAAWDQTRARMWISFGNGSLALVNPSLATGSGSWTAVNPSPPLPAGRRLEAFVFDSAGGIASWIVSDEIAVDVERGTRGFLLYKYYVRLANAVERRAPGAGLPRNYSWTSCVFDDPANPELLQYNAIRALGSYAALPFSMLSLVGGAGSLPSTPFDRARTCGESFFSPCKPKEFWSAFAAVVVFVIFWVVMIALVLVRRRSRRRRAASSNGLLLEVEVEVNGTSVSTYGRNGAPRRKHVKRFKWLREKIRGIFCFCRCCYDTSTGYLLCCYTCIGGRLEPSDGNHGKYQQLEDMGGAGRDWVYTGDDRHRRGAPSTTGPPSAASFTIGDGNEDREADPLSPPAFAPAQPRAPIRSGAAVGAGTNPFVTPGDGFSPAPAPAAASTSSSPSPSPSPSVTHSPSASSQSPIAAAVAADYVVGGEIHHEIPLEDGKKQKKN